jgi:hypothetical protein
LTITSFGPKFASLILLRIFTEFYYIGSIIPVSFDPTVDMQIHRGQQSIRFAFIEGLHSLRLVIVIEDNDVFSNQGDGGFVELTVQGDGTVFGHSSPCVFAEVILKVTRGGSETLHLSRKAFERALLSGGMFSLMVDIG